MRTVLIAALAAATTVACASPNRTERQTGMAEHNVTGGAYDSITANDTANGGSFTPTGDTASVANSSGNNSAEVPAATLLGQIEAADRMEIHTAELALNNAKSPAVKQLAQRLRAGSPGQSAEGPEAGGQPPPEPDPAQQRGGPSDAGIRFADQLLRCQLRQRVCGARDRRSQGSHRPAPGGLAQLAADQGLRGRRNHSGAQEAPRPGAEDPVEDQELSSRPGRTERPGESGVIRGVSGTRLPVTSSRRAESVPASLPLGIAWGKGRMEVDVHVHRISNRWGRVATCTPERVLGMGRQVGVEAHR